MQPDGPSHRGLGSFGAAAAQKSHGRSILGVTLHSAGGEGDSNTFFIFIRQPGGREGYELARDSS